MSDLSPAAKAAVQAVFDAVAKRKLAELLAK